MKSISTFIMVLICMVSFTSTATTAKMEQKRKTEFVKTVNVESNAVSVVNKINVASVLTDAKQLNDIDVEQLKNVNESLTHLAIITDVGWRSSNQLFNKIFHREKLQENLFTRDNPTRYCRSNY